MFKKIFYYLIRKFIVLIKIFKFKTLLFDKIIFYIGYNYLSSHRQNYKKKD